ncbi:MAG: hypothetical protein MUC87_14745 [Bacteroidia bacterium]|jgi:hypothetical protein|nr:hypothetical protein [Bacteroidia bacterium]
MSASFHIPAPCHESWQGMIPKENGRFCDSCCKVVVDFTTMNNDEITAYLRSRNGERVCGRVKNTQLDSKVSPAILSLPVKKRWHLTRFAAALWLVFGTMLFSGCGESDRMGDMQPVDSLPKSKTDTVHADKTIGKVKQQATIFTGVSKDDEHIIHMRPVNRELEIIREETVGIMIEIPELPDVAPADSTGK